MEEKKSRSENCHAAVKRASRSQKGVKQFLNFHTTTMFKHFNLRADLVLIRRCSAIDFLKICLTRGYINIKIFCFANRCVLYHFLFETHVWVKTVPTCCRQWKEDNHKRIPSEVAVCQDTHHYKAVWGNCY